MIAKGTFDVKMTKQEPIDEVDGVTTGRFHFDKVFHGPLDGTSWVEMLGIGTKVKDSRAYVAVERVTASLEGKRGSFVLTHVGTQQPDAMSLTLTIVKDSGTGELAGISGGLKIDIVEGKHFYTIDYALA